MKVYSGGWRGISCTIKGCAVSFKQRGQLVYHDDSLPWHCEDDVDEEGELAAAGVLDACTRLVFGFAFAFDLGTLAFFAATWPLTAGRTWVP